MLIHDAVKRFVRILELDELLDGAYIVADVERARRLDAAEDALLIYHGFAML